MEFFGCGILRFADKFAAFETNVEPEAFPTNSTTSGLEVPGVNSENVCAMTAGRPMVSTSVLIILTMVTVMYFGEGWRWRWKSEY